MQTPLINKIRHVKMGIYSINILIEINKIPIKYKAVFNLLTNKLLLTAKASFTSTKSDIINKIEPIEKISEKLFLIIRVIITDNTA